MFSSLSVRTFRIYWLGLFVSFIGTWIQTVAQSWLIFQLTNSAFLLGLVGFLGSIPVFLLSLFGGVAADRINKRNILILTQVAFMLLAFILAVLTQLNLITPRQIMLIAVFNGIVMAFDAPSRQAVVAELVGKEHLLNAIALNALAFNSSRVIGPALAGILIASIGMSGCFYVNAVSFLAMLSALVLIRPNLRLKANNCGSAVGDLKEGLQHIRKSRLILALIMMVGVASLFGISYTILMPIFAHDILHVGVKGLGVLMSSAGAGAVIAALILARLGEFKRRGRLLISSSIVFSLSLICFGVSKTYLFSIVTIMFIGGSSVLAMALINTLLQTTASDEFRGRVMSVFMFTFAGFMPFGNLIAGTFSQTLGAGTTVMLSGVVCVVSFLAINARFPEIRNLP
ncbi:MAG: MFS transporter [Candidatus Omnitrophota bacterium]